MCPDFSQPPKEDKTKIQKRTSCLGFYFIFFIVYCSCFRGKGRVELCIPNVEHFFKGANVFPASPL